MRFETARDVLLAYPNIAVGLRSQLDDTPSRPFLERLVAAGRQIDAVTFIAHILPRREAVWWGIKCVRMEPKAFEAAEEPLLAATEKWVAEPTEDNRRQVLASSDAADAIRPATWVARAAGWSGGVLCDTGIPKIMCEPYMSPAAVRAGVILASCLAGDPRAFLGRSLEEGMAILKKSQI